MSHSQQKAEVKHLEKKFVQRTEKYLQEMSGFLEHQFKQALRVCRTPECLTTVHSKYLQLEKSTIQYFDHISQQLEICIQEESPVRGVEGYKRCFTMFEALMESEHRKNLFKVNK